ncbi:MAG: polyprenol monophosphomannose synthase [Bacteriovoracaceae bacterium]|nr:polyprenol monophosphomannose synthase [Bacteriovoracaceae bacterium]
MENVDYSQMVVLIPTYNEQDNITAIIGQTFHLYPEISILVIDDNSPDGTAHQVQNLQNTYPHLHLLKRQKKEGLGRAYLAGFAWAVEKNFTYICTMDADFSHDPQDIQGLRQAVQQGYALAVGSRYIGGIRIINWPLKRLLLSYGGSIYTRLLTGLPLLDTNGGMNCYHQDAVKFLLQKRIQATGYAFQIELKYRLWSAGFKIKEVPITFTERRQGTSKMNGKIVQEALTKIPYLRWLKLWHRL